MCFCYSSYFTGKEKLGAEHYVNLPIIIQTLYMSMGPQYNQVQFGSIQLLSHFQLLATPWTAARQASVSITNSQSSLKLTSIKLVMPSSHLIDLGSRSYRILSFCLFILFMGFSRQEYWSHLLFPSPVDHILSDLSTMPARLGWPHTAWLSFIELDKAVECD